MIVEIYGAGFVNKGAQFMLWTTIQKLKEADPTVLCSMERRGTYEQRATYGLRTIFPGYTPIGAWPHRKVLNRSMRGAITLVPYGVREGYGLVRPSEPDALIDISGYAFGDKWGQKAFVRFTRRAAEYKRRGKPVVMLPQMFGPFEKPGYADLFRRLAEQVDLIYARDKISLEHVLALVPDTNKIRLAPDITIFSEVSPAGRADDAREYICVVPNMRMTDQGKESWGDRYVDLMVDASRQAAERGFDVHVVLHEASDGDIALGEQIVRKVGPDRARMIDEQDPLAIKRHLAASEFIVSSRFHSIVGALSSGVPAITLGWAHKYETILSDFGSPELLCAAQQASDVLPKLIGSLSKSEVRSEYKNRCCQAKEQMRDSANKMWADVATRLGCRRRNNNGVGKL